MYVRLRLLLLTVTKKIIRSCVIEPKSTAFTKIRQSQRAVEEVWMAHRSHVGAGLGFFTIHFLAIPDKKCTNARSKRIILIPSSPPLPRSSLLYFVIESTLI